MLSFLQSGWFWLLVGSILLLLAGCVLLPKKADIIIPTASQPILSFTVTPFSTIDLQNPPLSLSLEYVFTPNQQRSQRQVSPPSDDDFYTEKPSCFPSPDGGYSCLGRVWNNRQQDSGSILLSINLENQVIQAFSTEQRLIPSQSFAPYRAIIPANNSDSGNFFAEIERILPSARDYRKLQILNSRGQMSSTGRYRLVTTIRNDVGERLENVQLFASLVDDEQRVIGYRIYEVGDNLEIEEERVIELEIIPQVLPRTVHHELHAEGRVIE